MGILGILELGVPARGSFKTFREGLVLFCLSQTEILEIFFEVTFFAGKPFLTAFFSLNKVSPAWLVFLVL